MPTWQDRLFRAFVGIMQRPICDQSPMEDSTKVCKTTYSCNRWVNHTILRESPNCPLQWKEHQYTNRVTFPQSSFKALWCLQIPVSTLQEPFDKRNSSKSHLNVLRHHHAVSSELKSMMRATDKISNHLKLAY